MTRKAEIASLPSVARNDSEGGKDKIEAGEIKFRMMNYEL